MGNGAGAGQNNGAGVQADLQLQGQWQQDYVTPSLVQHATCSDSNHSLNSYEHATPHRLKFLTGGTAFALQHN